MSSSPIVAWRTGRPGRPAVPLPPAPMPLRRGLRPLKRWRWVGCFSDEVMLCAAVARIGPLPVSWYAIWDRQARTLAENTLRRGSAVRVDDGTVRIEDGPVRMELALEASAGVETVSPHGQQYIWTRKQPARATGTASIGEKAFTLDAPAFVDDSAGYHARSTHWSWSAGVGVAESGAAVAWNVVTGVHDALGASERSVWVDGEPHEVGPVGIADNLGTVTFAEGNALTFRAEATRAHRENLLLVATDYEQPFGSFTGTLPGAGRLREGLGVMERHSVRW